MWYIFQISAQLDNNFPSFKNLFRKIVLTTSLKKTRRSRDSSNSSLLIWCSTHTLWRTTSTIQLGPPPIFHSDTNPVLGHVLILSADKTYVPIVTVELIWLFFLNRISFKFFPIPDKSLRFTGFRRSDVNRPVVALIKFTLLFLARCTIFKVATFFFPQLFVPNDSVFAYLIFVEHTCCSNVVNSKVGKQMKRCEIVIHKYIKTKRWS